MQRSSLERSYSTNTSSLYLGGAANNAALLQEITSVSPRNSKWRKNGGAWLPAAKLSQAPQLHEEKDVNENVDSSSNQKVIVIGSSPSSSNNVKSLSSSPTKVTKPKMTTNDVVMKPKMVRNASVKKPKSAKSISTKSIADEQNIEERTSIFRKKQKKALSARNVCKNTNSYNYTKWEFGKVKTFVRPPNTVTTNKAATIITTIVRGWWQRLKYRTQLVQYKLRTIDERIAQKIHQMNMNVQIEKVRMLQDAKNGTALDKKIRQAAETLKEADTIVAYLRKQNMKLRQKNKKLMSSILELKHQNERLENVTYKGDDANLELQKFSEQIEETHGKLNEVIPKYLDSIQTLQDALDVRDKYCHSEKTVRILYTHLLGTIVSMMQNHYHNNNSTLVSDITSQVLTVEEEIKKIPNLQLLSDNSDNADDDDDDVTESSDSEDYDEYTIATFDE